ncbi:MAG: hypothetical protein OET90_06835 [Desulfuromonadales bacterium]|nr:hypothetical protein [Desulfuromonadales bacterium]
MAIFEEKSVVDANGKKTSVKGGIFSRVEMNSKGNTTCLGKRDVFNIKSEETCVVTPSTVVNNGK